MNRDCLWKDVLPPAANTIPRDNYEQTASCRTELIFFAPFNDEVCVRLHTSDGNGCGNGGEENTEGLNSEGRWEVSKNKHGDQITITYATSR